MNISAPTPLLGGLSPSAFMRRHWQKRPLLIRQALPGITPFVSRSELFAMASRDAVESRLIVHEGQEWRLRSGPLPRRALPPVNQRAWTLLVQGLDLHLEAARDVLSMFRFVPDARLDDLMLSWASDGGGVGPHVDSYDVFLLQLQGRRRWRIGKVGDASLQPGVPLKILQNFVHDEEWLLESGDMLYLPPGWAHEGVAQGECMTCSIGFRAPGKAELRDEVLQRMMDAVDLPEHDPLYRDPRQPATHEPGRIPQALQGFVDAEIKRWLRSPHALQCALGEVLSDPKQQVCFDRGDSLPPHCGVRLDRRTRMIYDDEHIFINGESFRASGRDARLMRQLADRRELDASRLAKLDPAARVLVDQWVQAGWLHPLPPA